MKTKWVRITHCDNIPLREGRSVKVGSREIAIFNLGDRFLAVDNRCPHKGGPLSEGIVSGTTVVCPLHAWKVDLECGAVKKPADVQVCVKTFRTRVEAGTVLLEVSTAEVVEIKPGVAAPPVLQSNFTQTEL
ncbi:MAG: nitrite reductase (NAD(P)H) small subunit [Acidobacteria bacterium]|nr:MAG: nitrite reductase (NAD(P)H) small subunit [Acidobacteriota bacterium]